MMPEFETIWKTYYPKLLLYSRSFHRLSDSDREDCVQEIFTQVYLHLDRYDDRWAFSTWIYRLARNRFIDYCRRSTRRQRREMVLEPDQPHVELATSHPQDSLNGSSPGSLQVILMLDLERAIDMLCDDDRELLHLYYGEEMKLTQITTVLNLPTGTLKSRLHRIRKQLRNLLEDNHEQ